MNLFQKLSSTDSQHDCELQFALILFECDSLLAEICTKREASRHLGS